MKRILKSFLVLLFTYCFSTNLSFGQELVEIDLGPIEGELKRIERTIQWTNSSQDTLKVGFWFRKEELSIEETTMTFEPGATLNLPVSIFLPERAGDHEFELRLLKDKTELLVGYQFRFKVLASENDVLKAYNKAFWPLRAKENVFNLKHGYLGDTIRATFDVYNFSGGQLDFYDLQTDSIYDVKFEPDSIEHNSFARMTLSLFSRGLELGFAKERISFYKEDKLMLSLPIQYTLVQRALASGLESSKFSINKLDHNFKVISVGDVVDTEFVIRNSGGADLEISNIESNCDCLRYELDHKKIKIGDSQVLRVIFDATDRIGLERKTLAIFTNDPERPTQVLTIRAHVK